MKKIISFVGLFAVLGVGIGDAHGVAMSAQVRRLLQEKQEKIEQLEKCEGKKQGWMIAGISTIGLTAVGVGVNIAQASKSNRLSSEIEMEKSTLERHQNELNRIQNDIAAEQLRQRREDCKKQSGKRWNENGYCEDVPGTGGGNGATVQVIEPTPMPALDNPDGEIGKPCGDNGGDIWTEKTDGTKKCSNVNGLVLCECVKGTTATPSGGMGDGNVVSNEQGTERKIGGPCVEEDMKKLYVSSGHYIRNEQTRLGTRCEPGNVLCAWFADSCEDGFELVYSNGKNQGWCKKTSGGGSSSSSSNTEKSSTSTATSGGTNSKSVTSNNGEKGSSSVAKTGGNTGTNSSVSSSSNTEKSSTSTATSGGTGCPDGMHISRELARCVDNCANNEREYAGVCLGQSQFAEIKTDSKYGLYCIRSYNAYPGGFADNTACAKICRNLGGEVVNVVNGSLQQAAYSGCDCTAGSQDCSTIFKDRLPQSFKDGSANSKSVATNNSASTWSSSVNYIPFHAGMR